MREMESRLGDGLSQSARSHLLALLGDWQLLADLSFSDLLLWIPTRSHPTAWPDGHRVVAQIRPSTGPTVFADDQVGQSVAWGAKPYLDIALSEERISRNRAALLPAAFANDEAIPVLHEGGAIAVITRHSSPTSARTPSRLELVYQQTAQDLEQMIANGRFPEPVEGDGRSPRVGDGLIRLDADGAISYASPNAASALRRLGVSSGWEGAKLGQLMAEKGKSGLTPTDEGWPTLLLGRASRVVTIEAEHAVVDMRVIPLMPAGERVGAVVLVHDVTEIDRRDRELVTKTATIREIHHRVKNNLQTVAALLRLQARRVNDATARAALEEAVQRVGSIAIVHETLSTGGSDDDVAFDDVADRIIDMLAHVVARPDVVVTREGSFGNLPSRVATPLSMIVNELISNALEHGVATVGSRVSVSAEREGDQLVMMVSDDGAGLPAQFASGTTLGLQIVRTLVGNELGGEITFASAGAGTTVRVHLPLG